MIAQAASETPKKKKLITAKRCWRNICVHGLFAIMGISTFFFPGASLSARLQMSLYTLPQILWLAGEIGNLQRVRREGPFEVEVGGWAHTPEQTKLYTRLYIALGVGFACLTALTVGLILWHVPKAIVFPALFTSVFLLFTALALYALRIGRKARMATSAGGWWTESGLRTEIQTNDLKAER